MNELLTVERLGVDVRTAAGDRTVVREVSLSLGTGQSLGVVGESGSGKSMTLRAVMRLLPSGARTSGRVLFDGQDVLTMREADLRRYRRRDIAMVHQDPAAFMNPVRTAGDFLTEQMRLADGVDGPTATKRATELLDRVLIASPERVLRSYPHELSGGMLQRVMIAAALASGPRLLLADEPTTALDVTTQAEVVAILDTLRREQGLALVFVTHDLDLAVAICDRIAVMYAGTVVEEQPAAGIVQRPAHPYTRALLLSRPDVSRSTGRLPVLAGRPLAAFEAGAGCAFAPRCPDSRDPCLGQRPQLRRLRSSLVACVRAEELLPADGAQDRSEADGG